VRRAGAARLVLVPVQVGANPTQHPARTPRVFGPGRRAAVPRPGWPGRAWGGHLPW